MAQGNLKFGITTNNQGNERTALTGTIGNDPAFTVRNGPSTISNTSGEGDAIFGTSGTGSGIRGRGPEGVAGEGQSVGVDGDAAGGTGVYGSGATGVAGVGDTFGAYGSSFDGTGVYANSANGNGVWGHSFAGPAGVYGDHGGMGAGVLGRSSSGHALEGQSGPNGVAGYFLGPLHVRDNGANIHGDVIADGALFTRSDCRVKGNCIISGNLQVFGNTKSIVMRHPDGTDRLLYCLEGAEAWFEDFGTGQLSDGQGRVELDDDYAALVETDEYHVFLTPEGDSNGLYIAAKDPRGFDVRERQGGANSLSFSYRVAARPKGGRRDRLAILEQPEQPEIPDVAPPPPTQVPGPLEEVQQPAPPTAPRRTRAQRES